MSGATFLLSGSVWHTQKCSHILFNYMWFDCNFMEPYCLSEWTESIYFRNRPIPLSATRWQKPFVRQVVVGGQVTSSSDAQGRRNERHLKLTLSTFCPVYSGKLRFWTWKLFSISTVQCKSTACFVNVLDLTRNVVVLFSSNVCSESGCKQQSQGSHVTAAHNVVLFDLFYLQYCVLPAVCKSSSSIVLKLLYPFHLGMFIFVFLLSEFSPY